MTTARTLIEGERFLHKDLWQVVERQLKHAVETPTGSYYDHLVAMVFALHSLEAYLNFVGGRLAPEIWKNEREFFRKQPYQGFDGKVRKILELVDLTETSRDVRPYSTVWFLKNLRDKIAHAKPFTFGHTIEHAVDEEPPLDRTSFDTIVSRENAERARDDIYIFVENIHTAAKPKVSDVWFGDIPFGGPIQYSSGHTTVAT